MENAMKRIITYSLAIGILSSGLLAPVANAQAASLTKAEVLVQRAEKEATALKWQISFEHTKSIKKPDMHVFNSTKNAYLAAQKEIAAISDSAKRTELEKKLEDSTGVHYKRSMGYIDAITSGNKIQKLSNNLQQEYRKNPTSQATETAYNALAEEIRKQGKLLYKVYGKSTREAFITQYKVSAEQMLINAKSAKIAKNLISNLDQAIQKKTTKDTILNELFLTLEALKDDTMYYQLFDEYSKVIRKDTTFVAQEKEFKTYFEKMNQLMNKKDTAGVFALYSKEFPDYDYLKEDIQSSFSKHHSTFELVNAFVYTIIGDYAYVEVEDIATTGTKKEAILNVYLLKKENKEWKIVDIFNSN